MAGSPTWLTRMGATLLTVIAVAAFVLLGQWQWDTSQRSAGAQIR
jgi:DNA-binding transcriptional regulator of glucitol operon